MQGIKGDKAKGIICNPMPKHWYDRREASKTDDADFDRSIAADKKPYFMIYSYNNLKKEYKSFVRNAKSKCRCWFSTTPDELKKKPYSDLSEQEIEFLRYYDMNMPVGISDCVMNKICWRFEEEFDGYMSKHRVDSRAIFDPSILSSGMDLKPRLVSKLRQLFLEFNEKLQEIMIDDNRKFKRVSADMRERVKNLEEQFRRESDMICSNEKEKCDILLDICYKANKTKRFAWAMCGPVIIENLLDKNNRIISFPVQSPEGSILFDDLTFKVQTIQVERVDENDSSE